MSEEQEKYELEVRDAAPPAPLRFSPEKIDLLKRTICKEATDDELEMFLYVCEQTGLNPFLRQIHAVKRWNSKTQRKEMTIQTGIDGYRLTADRTRRYAGNDEPVFVGKTKEGYPAQATATVYKLVGGQRYAFTGTARWVEYVGKRKDGQPTSFWRKMPHGQLAKCAEALALRKAFPAELSGIYTNTEMMQADVIEAQVTEIKDEPKQGNGNGGDPEQPEKIIVNGKWTKMPPRPLKPAQLKEVMEYNASKKAGAMASPGQKPSQKQVGLLAGKLEEALGANQDAQVNRYTFTQWLTGERSLTKLGVAWIATLLEWLLGDKDETNDYPFKAHAVEEANKVLRQAMLDQGQQELPAAQFDPAPQEALGGLGFTKGEHDA